MDLGQLANLIVALATLVTAITALLKVRKTDAKVDDNTTKLVNVETAVNGTHQIALDRIDQLGESLTKAGVAIPSTPKVEVGKGNAV